jgi:hypothetical protein
MQRHFLGVPSNFLEVLSSLLGQSGFQLNVMNADLEPI